MLRLSVGCIVAPSFAFKMYSGYFPFYSDLAPHIYYSLLASNAGGHEDCADSSATVLLQSKSFSYELLWLCCKCQLTEDKTLDLLSSQEETLWRKVFVGNPVRTVSWGGVFSFSWCLSALLLYLAVWFKSNREVVFTAFRCKDSCEHRFNMASLSLPTKIGSSHTSCQLDRTVSGS